VRLQNPLLPFVFRNRSFEEPVKSWTANKLKNWGPRSGYPIHYRRQAHPVPIIFRAKTCHYTVGGVQTLLVGATPSTCPPRPHNFLNKDVSLHGRRGRTLLVGGTPSTGPPRPHHFSRKDVSLHNHRGSNPWPPPLCTPSLTTALHSDMRSYLIFIPSYYTTLSVNCFFKALNGFKLKTW
jgi:hypothetical protein